MAKKREPEPTGVDGLVHEVRELRRLHFFRKQRTWPQMIWYNVVRGMAFGFGSLVGATVIVSIVVWILSQMVSQFDFIPLLGEWVTKILEIVESSSGPN